MKELFDEKQECVLQFESKCNIHSKIKIEILYKF